MASKHLLGISLVVLHTLSAAALSGGWAWAEGPSVPPPGASVPGNSAGPKVAHQFNSLEETVIRDLEDPENPYKGQYSAYDRWVYDNWVPALTNDEMMRFNSGKPEDAAFRASYPADWRVAYGVVDSQGFLVPNGHTLGGLPGFQSGSIRDYAESIYSRRNKTFYSIQAAGIQPPEMQAELKASIQKRISENAPPLPAWLGEHPPLSTVFAPNGDILCYGPLDLHYAYPEGVYQSSYSTQGEQWYRYDAQGKLLGSLPASARNQDSGWRSFYYDESRLLEKTMAKGAGISTSSCGRYRIYGVMKPASAKPEEESRQVPEFVAAYDYDGSEVSLDTQVDEKVRVWGTPIEQSSLKRTYEAQLALGCAGPAGPSPYWGTPEGPVFVDPTPRPLRKLAASSYGPDGMVVDVRALDDAASPYREEYGPVERWVYDNCSRSYQTIVDGGQVDLKDKYSWGKAAYTADISACCDAQGALIPLARRPLWLERLELVPDPARQEPELRKLPSLWAHGEMPAEAWDAYCAQTWQAAIRHLPSVPDWLIRRKHRFVVLLPDGSLLAQEALERKDGMRINFIEAGVWIHYDGSGAELRRATLDRPYEWAAFFDPMFSIRQEEARGQGYSAFLRDGYLVVAPKDGGADAVPLVAYDYTGAPVDAAALSPRAPGICKLLNGDDIERIYAIQQYMRTRPSQ